MTVVSSENLNDILYRMKTPNGCVDKDYKDAAKEIEHLRKIMETAFKYCFVETTENSLEVLKQCFANIEQPRSA
jgi:ribosomal protein S7